MNGTDAQKGDKLIASGALIVHKTPNMRTKLYNKTVGYFFLFPFLFFITIFTIYPALSSLYNSFHLISPFGNRTIFVGIGNYVKLLTSETYLNSLRVTLTFVLGTVPLGLVLALVLALLLNLKLKGIGIYRTAFFLPIAISPAMAGIIWLFFFNTHTGFINYAIKLIGIKEISWLADPSWALLAIIIVTIWKQLGFNIIIFLAGLQQISEELYEAAMIDGAGKLQKFYHITIPLLSPTLFFLMVTSVMHTFEVFGQVHVLTHGGPAQATNLLVYALYRDAFINFNTGAACAQAYLIFMIILVITLIQFKVLGKKVHYQ